MRRTLDSLRRLPLVFLALVLTGCTAASVDEHLKHGDSFLADKKVAEAIVAYRAAVQADPRNGRAHQKLGEAYLLNRDFSQAFREFVLAADVMPDDIQAQLRAGQVLSLVGQFEDAKGRADRVLNKEPNNVQAHILKGNALAALKDFSGALTQIQEAIKTDPTSGTGYSHLGSLQLARGDLKQAEAAFKRAIDIDSKSAAPRLALANLYWSSGRQSEAEEQIKTAAALEPTNVLPNQALALLFLGTNRTAEAEAPLKAVADHAGTWEGKVALADYYASVRRLPEAKALYEQAAADREGFPTASLRLAALGLDSGDRAGAYQTVQQILAREPSHANSLVALARLQLGDGKLVEARASAQKAVAADPNSPLAHHVLGLVLSAQQQPEEAELAFKNGVRVSPDFAPINVELAKLAIASGKYSEAVQYARTAINRVPMYLDAHLLLVRAMTAMGNTSDAEASIKVLVAALPDSAVVNAEIGRLLLAKGDTAGAVSSFSRALAADPLQVSAVEGLVTAEIRMGRRQDARKRLDAAVAAAPKTTELQLVAARLYATSFNDLASAERAVRRVIDTDSSNLPAYDLLARIYVQGKNLPAATAEFEKLAQRQPRSVGTHTAVGILYHLQNKLVEAKAAYERALGVDPRAPVAANNLAQLYSDRNENLEVALQLAQTAKAGLPTAPEVDDTLGWIYYKKGNGPAAVTSLKQAVAAQPGNAVYLYHLGAAYALTKDVGNARQTLEKALKSPGGFDGAQDARKILNSLGG